MKKSTLILVVLLAIIGVVFLWFNSQQSKFLTARADIGNVIEIVSETGELAAQQDFNLKFKVSGNLKTVNVALGDSVKQGQKLAELDDQELNIQLNEARAGLNAAQANLKKIREGARREDIQVYKTAVANAEIALGNTQEELTDVKKSTAESISLTQSELEASRIDLENTEAIAEDDLSDIYQNAPIIINGSLIASDQALDSVKEILDLDRKDNDLKVSDSRLLISTIRKEEDVVKIYTNTLDFFDSIRNDATNEELDTALDSVASLLEEVHDLLGLTETLLDKTISTTALPQTEIDRLIGIIDIHNDHITAKKSEITATQQSIEVIQLVDQSKLDKLGNAVTLTEQKLSSVRALSSAQINSSENAVRSAQGALKSARDNLTLKEANPLGSDINFYQAKVNQAQSRIDLVNEQLNNLILKAPADGLITLREIENGEFINAGQTAIAMIAEESWQVEVYVAEEDILKVQINDLSEVTLDAYGQDKIFSGRVFFSEPQRTIIDDSVYYKTIVILDKDDKNFRNGMTADINIITGEKTNVLRINKRALKERSGKFIVRVKKNLKITDRDVAVGLIGADYAEIISGLSKDEEVVIVKK